MTPRDAKLRAERVVPKDWLVTAKRSSKNGVSLVIRTFPAAFNEATAERSKAALDALKDTFPVVSEQTVTLIDVEDMQTRGLRPQVAVWIK